MTVVADILATDVVDGGDVARAAHTTVRTVNRWQRN
jgi:hypothetical protein